MSLRTITAPGVQITEIDKSDYAPSMTGTRVLVQGFANKGEDYEPMEFTSRSAWINYYGEPDNEPERYFYNACMEVINQNGILYCAKLPYDNEAKDKISYKKFKVGLNPTIIKSVADYVKTNKVMDILDGQYARFGYMTENSGLTDDQKEYVKTITNLTDYQEDLESYNKQKHLNETTLRLKYDETETSEDDDWKYYKQSSIIDRLNVLFNPEHTFWSEGEGAGTHIELSAIDTYAREHSIVDDSATITVDDRISAFIDAFAETFDSTDKTPVTEFEPWNFVYSKLNTSDVTAIRDFIADNASAFADLSAVSSDNADCPWVYTDEFKFNLTSYYTAAYYKAKTASITEAKLADIITGINSLYAEGIASKEPFKDLSAEFANVKNELSTLTADNISELKPETLVELINEINTFVSDKDGKYPILAKAFAKFDSVSNKYVRAVIKYYTQSINITNFYDQDYIKSVTTLAGLMKSKDEEGAEDERSLLEKYGTGVFDDDGNELTADTNAEKLEIVLNAFNKEMLTAAALQEYVKDITESDIYEAIKDKINNSNSKAVKAFTVEAIIDGLAYAEIANLDATITSYRTIDGDTTPVTMELDQLDEYRTGEAVVAPNTIVIADITRAKYGKSSSGAECVGIVPVITTAANAMMAQSLIDIADGEAFYKYNAVTGAQSIAFGKHTAKTIDASDLTKAFASEKSDDETISKEAASYFSGIQMTDTGTVDRENLDKIGIVVYRTFVDATENNKISFVAVESFVGSLDKDAKNPATGATAFIDTIVNTQSQYINVFSNIKNPTSSDMFVVKPSDTATLGFYEDMCVENISLAKSILQGMSRVFDKTADINERDIDIVVDAGISNIAQYIKTVYGNGSGAYDPTSVEASMFKLKSRNSTLTWRAILQKFDTFCKLTRKDCMFIADGLRPLCLVGNQKIVRPTKPSNTIDANILPYMKFLTGINSSYGAGYCDWFMVADEFTGENFWCPPSIKACGIYIYTDSNYQYWDAPAGLNRGIISALDTAFSPTNKQAGSIYEKAWNYAINYPADGIVLEGQKTFQVKPSAFDRVNVRRLFLRLERQTYKVARYFVYEGNTAYNRQRFVDTINPIFENAKLNGGIYDYKIICDESINTPNVIDNNEMRCKIGIKPVKTSEFIMIDFIALRTGGSFSEM